MINVFQYIALITLLRALRAVIASGSQKDELAFDRLMELSYSEDKGIRGNCFNIPTISN